MPAAPKRNFPHVYVVTAAVSDEGNGLVWLAGVKQSGGDDKVKGDHIQTVTLW